MIMKTPHTNVDYDVTKVITNTEMRGDGGIGVDLGRLDQT